MRERRERLRGGTEAAERASEGYDGADCGSSTACRDGRARWRGTLKGGGRCRKHTSQWGDPCNVVSTCHVMAFTVMILLPSLFNNTRHKRRIIGAAAALASGASPLRWPRVATQTLCHRMHPFYSQLLPFMQAVPPNPNSRSAITIQNLEQAFDVI